MSKKRHLVQPFRERVRLVDIQKEERGHLVHDVDGPRRLRVFLRPLRPEEWLCLGFAALLALLTTFFTGSDYGWPGLFRTFRYALSLSLRARTIPFFSSHLAFFLLLAIATYAVLVGRALMLPSGRGARVRATARDFAGLCRAYVPFLACYAVYALLRDMIPHVRSAVLDGPLAWIEFKMFGTLACTATYRALESGAATWLLSKAYASHFYVPPLVAFLFYVRRDVPRFRNFMLAITITSFAGYLGYVLVPAGGPRYAVAGWEAIRAGQSTDATLSFVDFWGRTAMDCFPSLHTAWTVVTAIFLYRFSKTLFALYLPIAAGLVVACLYFGYHYLVDLPAGACLAVASIFAADRLHRWWAAEVRDWTAPSGAAP